METSFRKTLGVALLALLSLVTCHSPLLFGQGVTPSGGQPAGTDYRTFSIAFAMPACTPSTTSLSLPCSAGVIYQGGGQFTIVASTVTLTANQSSCAAPLYTSCNIVYWPASGSALNVTTSPVTAGSSGNAVVGFATTSASGVILWVPATLAHPTLYLPSTLNFGNNTPESFSFGAATGGGTNMLSIADGAANTGTGFLVNIALSSGSAGKPLNVANASGIGFSVPANGFVTLSSSGAFVSGSANPAASGVFRLASADAINFRNNANGADVGLSKTSGDLLVWGGSNPTDGYYVVPLNGCGLTLSAGVLGSAAAGTLNPGPIRIAANNWVLQVITTAAANTAALDCDITPPSRLTSGKGVTINDVQIFYGVQTTALSSITAATISTMTYPATGGAAGATLAGAGGVLTTTPVTLQLATTTSGQCYSENISLGTPLAVNTDLQRVTLEELFNQSAASAEQVQVCGVRVHYTNAVL